MNTPAQMTIYFMDGTSELFVNPERLYSDHEPGMFTFFDGDSFLRIPMTSVKKIVATPKPEAPVN